MKGIGNSTRVDVVQAKTTPQHVRINANGHGRHGEQKVKEELQLFFVCKQTGVLRLVVFVLCVAG
jgi:hypothetical protein